MQRPFRGHDVRRSIRRLAPALVLSFLLPMAFAAAPIASAQDPGTEPTPVEVHVLSKGAKLIGSSMMGVRVTVEDAETGEVLARGVTVGTTGDTDYLMKQEHRRGEPLATGDAAVFTTDLALDRPRRLRFTAYGPLAQRQAANEASVTQWVVPGKGLTGGDGVLLEIPGMVVDVVRPFVHGRRSGLPQTIEVAANVTMMCGCPIQPGGLWDSEDLEIRARVQRDGRPFTEIDLPYAGEASSFAGTFTAGEPGLYQITVFAYDPDNGNTGVDFTTVLLGE